MNGLEIVVSADAATGMRVMQMAAKAVIRFIRKRRREASGIF
jgi:hypothetical protein